MACGDLGTGVHHERAVVLDVLADGLAAEYEDLQVGRVDLLAGHRPAR